ncbi:hypothetical protein EBU71_11560 [bacterium]|nr:hypothetical protein [Candidatus Elulimicrobium humile]
MGRNSLELQMMALAINQVLGLCYEQRVSTTLRDVFQLLRMPEGYWIGEWGLDDPIIINSEEELIRVRDEILARFGGARH